MGPHDIHWHIANLITYFTTDRQRQTITYVKVQYPNGDVQEFRAAGVPENETPRGEERTMDCMDCHNRPSHPFAPTAGRAIDDELADGTMPKTLPFVRQQAVELTKKPYPSQEAALQAIAAGLLKYYQEQYPQVFAERRADVDRAVTAAQHAYRRNVFPQMKVTWGTYLNNLGHNYSAGCFRCHDGEHMSKNGKAIPQDCDLCHEIVQ
jgi:formate-dependent nitrite reductase cytochrome c552 subunit